MVDVVFPESGSIVVRAVNEANITLFCRLTMNGDLHAVTWLIADEGVDVSIFPSPATLGDSS